jgi:hypothetical protein
MSTNPNQSENTLAGPGNADGTVPTPDIVTDVAAGTGMGTKPNQLVPMPSPDMSTVASNHSQSVARILNRCADENNPDRYVEWALRILGTQLAAVQAIILRAMATEQRLLIIAGNGVGKSFAVTVGTLAFMYNNPNAVALLTSGSYSQLTDSTWRPMKKLLSKLQDNYPMYPGRALDSNPPRIEFEDNPERYFKAVSPQKPKGLEGRHDEHVLVIIEEADDDRIIDEHFESARTSATDDQDRLVAVANPPRSHADVVHEKATDDSWTTIQFDSFMSHNVQSDLGLIDDDPISGLVDLNTLREDYTDKNDRPWPGINEAIQRPYIDPATDEINDPTNGALSDSWYRRRLGVIPPEGVDVNRPFGVEAVENAWSKAQDWQANNLAPNAVTVTETPQALALDVARSGGDRTVLTGRFGDELRVIDFWNNTNHAENNERVRALIAERSSPRWNAPLAIDAVGEGSALADRIAEWYPWTNRYSSGSVPANAGDYKDKWSEGLQAVSDFLDRGGIITHEKLREELLAIARVVRFEETHISSRGPKNSKVGADVYQATPKSEVKDYLNRSPDLADSAIICSYTADRDQGRPSVSSTWAR